MKGKIVKTALERAGRNQDEVAAALGISREHFNRMLNGEVKDKYLDRLRSLEIPIDDVINSDSESDNSGRPSDAVWARAMRVIEEMAKDNLKDCRENIHDLRENNKSIRYTSAELTDSHRTYRTIVEKFLDVDAILFDKDKGRELLKRLSTKA